MYTRQESQRLPGALVGLVLGVLLWIASRPMGLNRLGVLAWAGASKVGITIVVLLPLAIWAVHTLIRDREDKLTFSYIGSQATTWGFIGTIIGTLVIYAALEASLRAGDSEAIKQAIGGFRQALISTAVGLVISSFCKHFHYTALKKSQTNTKEILP